MPKTRLILLFSLLTFATAWAQDEFATIQCGADIPKALIGKHVSSGSAAATENRHKNLGLKNLGGDEISDLLFLASWRICGSEYELLVNSKQNVIRDVLMFPTHSATSPMFVGACQMDGKEAPGTIVAVLNNSEKYSARDRTQAKTMLKATAAWKIDEAKEKFDPLPAGNLRCPLDGVITEDGGP